MSESSTDLPFYRHMFSLFYSNKLEKINPNVDIMLLLLADLVLIQLSKTGMVPASKALTLRNFPGAF